MRSQRHLPLLAPFPSYTTINHQSSPNEQFLALEKKSRGLPLHPANPRGPQKSVLDSEKSGLSVHFVSNMKERVPERRPLQSIFDPVYTLHFLRHLHHHYSKTYRIRAFKPLPRRPFRAWGQRYFPFSPHLSPHDSPGELIGLSAASQPWGRRFRPS